MPENEANNRKILYLVVAILKTARKDIGKDLRKLGLSYPQFGAMRMIKAGSKTIAELAKGMMLEPATLVPVIDNLENKNLIRREPDTKDRRKNLLALTAKGEQIVAAIQIDRKGPLAKALAKIGARKSAQLSLLLQELVQTMQHDPNFLEEIKKFL